MNSNKSLRIIVGGVLLVLAAAALRWALFKPEGPAATDTAAALEQEQQAPGTTTRQRPGVRNQPASRTASTRTASTRASNLPSQDAAKRLFVDWKGTWYPAEILSSANGSYFIRYSGYGSEWDEWVTPDRMRYSDPLEAPPQNRGTPPDSTVDLTVRMAPTPGDPVVLWGNQWWRAEVLRTEGDKSLIRYVGYGAEWDEWVGADRFKVYSEADAQNAAAKTTLTAEVAVPEATTLPVPQPDQTPVVQGRPAHGDLLVEWGKQWWPAEVVKQEGSSYFIHYKGYGTNWDEWVTFERLGIYSGTE